MTIRELAIRCKSNIDSFVVATEKRDKLPAQVFWAAAHVDMQTMVNRAKRELEK